MSDHSATEALAEAWASIDGKMENFRAEREMSSDDPRRHEGGYYDGYMFESEELQRRLAARGYVLVRKDE